MGRTRIRDECEFLVAAVVFTMSLFEGCWTHTLFKLVMSWCSNIHTLIDQCMELQQNLSGLSWVTTAALSKMLQPTKKSCITILTKYVIEIFNFYFLLTNVVFFNRRSVSLVRVLTLKTSPSQLRKMISSSVGQIEALKWYATFVFKQVWVFQPVFQWSHTEHKPGNTTHRLHE